MVQSILPTSQEEALLSRHTGDASELDRPEQLLLSLCGIGRLEGRIRAMMFKAQCEPEMEALSKQVDDLAAACEAVRGSVELHALMQVRVESEGSMEIV
eukprot:scaffold34046_cov101-Isochrysis_galbana.AAC.1